MLKISHYTGVLIMILTSLFNISVEAEINGDTLFCFLTKPYLQNLNDSSVTIMWLTNRPTTSWIEYGKNESLGNQHRQSKHGLIDAGLPVQKMSLSGLTPGTKYYYKVASVEIVDYGPYNVLFGDTIFSDTYSFTTPVNKLSQFSFLAFNDVHDKPDFIKEVISREATVNFIVYLGDIMGHIENSETIINNLLKPSAEFFAAEIPFIYVRGNHEARGAYARKLIDYIHVPDHEYYYSFTFGPVFFIVLDCGEDKGDDHPSYSGLVDFDEYRREQSLWLNQVINSREFKESEYQIVLSHFPLEFGEITGVDDIHKHGRADVAEKFGVPLNSAGADLWLCGHMHRHRIIYPAENNASFPVVIGGGPYYQPGSTYTRVDYVSGKMVATLKTTNGDVIERLEINCF